MTAKSSSSKTILITGSSTGFGRGTAEILARNGHVVFASMRDVAGRNKNHAKSGSIYSAAHMLACLLWVDPSDRTIKRQIQMIQNVSPQDLVGLVDHKKPSAES